MGMAGSTVSYDELRELLGDQLDDIALERILATGACFEDVAEAVAYFEAETTGERVSDPISSRVVEVRAILDDSIDRDDLADDDRAGDSIVSR
jgi:hypothetical protein